ncbi:MAG: hypothetical protein R3C18_08640 [Planctomycetaceae bacterium]
MNWNDVTTFQWIIYCFSLLLTFWLGLWLIRSLRNWQITSRLYGGIPLGTTWQMMQSLFRTRGWRRLRLSIELLIVALIVVWFAEIKPAWILLVPVALILPVTVLALTEPPAVLLLGSSQWETVRVAARIRLYIHSYRQVYLLDESAAQKARTSWLDYDQFEFNNLRIHTDYDWQKFVFPLTESVPIIVLDTRFPSPAVLQEARRLLDSNLKHKTVFLTNEDGSAPALNAISETANGLLTATSETIGHVVRGLGLNHTTSPIDQPGFFLDCNRRIESCTTRVFELGSRFQAALNEARSVHGESAFVNDAGHLLRQLSGSPGDGLNQMAADLDKDIEAVESFLERWSASSDSTVQGVLAVVRATCQRLAELQVAFDAAEVNFVEENTALLDKFGIPRGR